MTTTTRECYPEHEGFPDSPLLQEVKVSSTPTPSPPPIIIEETYHHSSRIQTVSSPSQRSRNRPNRRKTQATQGDWVLLSYMEPNRPDIAQLASEQALNSDSASEVDEIMQDNSHDSGPALSKTNPVHSTLPSSQPRDLPQIAQRALGNAIDGPPARSGHRDSVVEADDPKSRPIVLTSRPSHASIATMVSNVLPLNTKSTSATTSGASTLSNASSNQTSLHHGCTPNGQSHDDSLATSPRLQQLTISQPRGSATDILPALQTQTSPRDGNPGSPSQQLPSFRHIDDIARSATSDHEASRSNSFAHRQSVSSVGQSPTSIVRQLSISSHSPATPFPPLNASSPLSANGDLQRGDIFLRSGGGGVFGADARRASQPTSDGVPYSTNLRSASTSDGYPSSDGLSPATGQPPIEGRPRHLSLDGALASRVLPPPIISGIQHIPSHGAGAFKCDYPSCTAAPFQTQYLLK